MRWISLCIFMGLLLPSLWAQDTQEIRGRVIDKTSKQPLVGVTVLLFESEPTLATVTDFDGFYKIEVPLGRQQIEARYLGYEPFLSKPIIISAAKEINLDIEMLETVQETGQVTVTAAAASSGNEAINELSVVSTRSFSVEETQRYAASINDPGRMVMAFPGVQANQDTENDIIIRGNSAVGVLWRVEGLDIANPSHFARPATTGGGITVFSASLLSNSDFSTGAFAAEYGNAFSGVFDVRFRKGNLEKREYTFRAGVIGIDFAAEGPIKKGRSSYLINYRYSTLGILAQAGLHVVRENVSNTFQDLSFNLYFSGPKNKDRFTIFGMGGLSQEYWWMLPTDRWQNSLDYVWDANTSNLGVLGTTYTRLIDDKSFFKMSAGVGTNYLNDYQVEPTIAADSTYWLERNNFLTTKFSWHGVYSRKINRKLRLKAGLISTYYLWDLEYGLFQGDSLGYQNYLGQFTPGPRRPLTEAYFDPDQVGDIPTLEGEGELGSTFSQQAYSQASYHVNEKFTINAGAHFLFLALNADWALDPRLSMRYTLSPNTKFTFAYGLHSKIQPFGTYMLSFEGSDGQIYQPNKDLKFTRAHHLIAGVEQMLTPKLRLQVEGYFQQLFNVPISTDPNSNFWFYNLRDNYGTIPMTSEGKGQNYGVDLTLEQFFGKGFFMLFTASAFRSTFKAWEEDYRPARLDNRFSTSLMATKEFIFKNGGVLQLGVKTFFRGGLHHQEADLEASRELGAFVEDQEAAFDASFPPYFRLDTRIAYRKDHKNFSYTLGLDIQNATNKTDNWRAVEYDRNIQSIVLDPNSGLLPVLSFQIDF
ncbi:carboxypeptidase-like regulatory domain-containing protein [Saprospira sp. CCB-QB6]|uniref:TonB-dependent receptor n=1 Tax=Saprospira sp. CCB-QB6 TaxID=3023936 RepID=UPI002349ED89|nr:carboxypeptidase-like regulatory domain-containing protein [Saprospira sp. CCB-QB6]WCL81470.1 carboxypeptidase-like regulatory domain-containing protein [Saprospira sp. CCB-QB6]